MLTFEPSLSWSDLGDFLKLFWVLGVEFSLQVCRVAATKNNNVVTSATLIMKNVKQIREKYKKLKKNQEN